MVRRREDLLFAQVGVQVVDVLAPLLDLGVLALVDAEDVDVDPLARVGEPGLDLLRDEEVFEVRLLVQKVQATVDRVVIGQRDEVHPALLGETVDVLGSVVRVARVRDAEVLERRIDGVAVEVRFLEAIVGEPARLFRLGSLSGRHARKASVQSAGP